MPCRPSPSPFSPLAQSATLADPSIAPARARLSRRRTPWQTVSAWLVGGLLAGSLAACTEEVVTLPDLAPQSGDTPMFYLGPGNLPKSPPVVKQLKYEYYECSSLVSEWFLKLLVAEMNYLEKASDLTHVDGSACAVSRGINQGVAEPRFTVHLFSSRKAANDCVVNLRCERARNVMLVPREGAVWRSYFLSDFEYKKFYMHCLAPRQQWHKAVSCDTVPPAGA